jgi:hypothetical protein
MNGCLSCGADNAGSSLYCVKCGTRLEPPAPPPESWRYSGDFHGAQADQANRPPAYQWPPAYPGQPPYAPQQSATPYQSPSPYVPSHVSPQPATTNNSLPQVGMTMGIVVACIAALGLIPCLGWLNWFTIIFGKITIILCIVALVTEKDPNRRSKAVVGLVIAAAALCVGIVRLIIGGGCL